MLDLPKKIMIIDDDPLLLDVEGEALQRNGNCEVRLCIDYDQAITAFDDFLPELILLDLKLPGKDGTDILEDIRIREDAANIPIIFVTGERRLEMQDDYKKLGVLGIIYKPFKPADFVANIRNLWKNHHSDLSSL